MTSRPNRSLRDLGRVPFASAIAVEQHLHRLCGVRRVRVRRLADRLPEALDERLRRARQLVGRDARRVMYVPSDAVPAVLIVAASIGVNPSGSEERHVRPKPARRSFISLAPLLQMIPPRKTASAPGLLDRVRERLVARLLRVPALEAGDLDAELLRRVLERRRDAEAVRLLVVQDVDLLEPMVFANCASAGALELVGRDDAGVVALAGRVVLRPAHPARCPALFVRPGFVFAGLTIASGPGRTVQRSGRRSSRTPS